VTVTYQRLGRLSYLLFMGFLGSLVLLQVGKHLDLSFVPSRNGSWRWIEIGSIQLQRPS